MSDTVLELHQIEKSFGETKVLEGINLSIQKGEFITLLGSSGCGKTTTLRIIAGLESPDQGSVILNGVNVTDLEPNKRDVNTVFQNYALFPHMDVETNIGYSLKIRKTDKKEIKKKVKEALELVQLQGLENRMPSELSGGQKQRVAIARAIVNNPKILLLDEPLGALDLQLRRQMQVELKRLQKKLGITFIYITHDQEEAINMSDRIVVMKEGTFEQIGTPSEVYDHPKTSYVARFVGTANIVVGTVTSFINSIATINIMGGVAEVFEESHTLVPGQKVTIAVRSENIELCHDALNSNDQNPIEIKGLRAVIKEKSFAGGMLRINLELEDGTEIIVSRHGIDSDLLIGSTNVINWDPKNAVIVDLEG